MFSVVEFTVTKEVEAVPKSWLTKDGSCWWPVSQKVSAVMEAIRKCETPNPQTFQCYPIRVLHHYSTYEIAKAKLKQAEIDSELSSEAEQEGSPTSSLGPRNRFMPRQLRLEQHNEDSDDSEMPPPQNSVVKKTGGKPSGTKPKRREVATEIPECSIGLPPAPPVPQNSKDTLKDQSVGNSQQPSHVLGLLAVSPQREEDNQEAGTPRRGLSQGRETVRLNTGPRVELTSRPEVTTEGCPVVEGPVGNFQSWVVRNINLMKAQLDQIQDSLDVIVRGQVAVVPSAVPFLHQDEFDDLLPIKSVENMDMLFDAIAKEGNRHLLVSKLSTRGGKNVSDSVRRILKRLLTDQVAMTFNWIGSRGAKCSFKNSVLPEIIYDSVRVNVKHAAVKEMEDVIKDWLRNAKKRIDKSGSQSGKRQTLALSESNNGANDEHGNN